MHTTQHGSEPSRPSTSKLSAREAVRDVARHNNVDVLAADGMPRSFSPGSQFCPAADRQCTILRQCGWLAFRTAAAASLLGRISRMHICSGCQVS